MIIVIQCAGSKQPDAGCMQDENGRQLMFVGRPELAPPSRQYRYVHPDGDAGNRQTWRDKLVAHCNEKNSERSANPWRLLPAYALYRNPTYQWIVSEFGVRNTYILSAGWGLIRADFPTPAYDITFTGSAKPWQKRHRGNTFHDFNQLPHDAKGPIMFFGGKDYVPFFCALTLGHAAPRTVFYHATTPPHAPGCTLERYDGGRLRTNWHYQCAQWFAQHHANWCNMVQLFGAKSRV